MTTPTETDLDVYRTECLAAVGSLFVGVAALIGTVLAEGHTVDDIPLLCATLDDPAFGVAMAAVAYLAYVANIGADELAEMGQELQTNQPPESETP